MSNLHRRDILTGAAAIAAGMTAGLVGPERAEAGDPSFMNNVPDPLLSGNELPTFKFALEKSKGGHVDGKSYSKDANVRQLPISKGIAGVTMGMAPGAMRELHWHPTADEWQYVYEGQVSVTLFGSGGRYRIETLEQGDVGYIPQGYGHSLENVGDKTCRVLIGFNTGEYETIDLSQWIAANPTDVLAANFGKPASLFEKFPRKDVFIADKESR